MSSSSTAKAKCRAPASSWASRWTSPSCSTTASSPPYWQTAICLPDDWQKTLVGKDGAMLYDYPGDFAPVQHADHDPGSMAIPSNGPISGSTTRACPS